MRNPIFILSLVFFTSLSCGNSKKAPATDRKEETVSSEVVEKEAPKEKEWTLVSIEGAPEKKSLSDLFPGEKPTITIEHKSNVLYGSTGCNRYNTTYELDGNKFKVNESILMTKKYCQDVQEHFFIEKLKLANGYSVNDGVLKMTQDGKPLMTFEKK